MEKSVEKSKSDMNRAEYIEVEPNVCLHITDAGEGRPIVLIPGWPLSDEMYEYQYNDLINKNFRVRWYRLKSNEDLLTKKGY